MNKHKWLEISEYVYLGLILLGTVAATVTQQVVYAVIPLILSLANLENRYQGNYSQLQPKIAELQTNHENLKNKFYQINEAMNTSNDRLQKIEAWKQQFNQIIDQKIETSIQKILIQTNQFPGQIQNITNRLNQLEDSIKNLYNQIQEQGVKLEIVENIQSEILDIHEKMKNIEIVNSQLTQIAQVEISLKNWTEMSQQELGELRENQKQHSLELITLNHKINDINYHFKNITNSLQELNQSFSRQVQELDQFKQDQNSENSRLNHSFESLNQSLQELDTSFDTLITLNHSITPLELIEDSDVNFELHVAVPSISTLLAENSTENTEKLLFVGTLKGHNYRVSSVTFSPDGQNLASGSDDKTIKIWDLKTQEYRTFTGHKEKIKSVAFSPDGKILASGSNDKTIKLWDVNTGTEIFTFTGHQEKVNSVVFSPLGNILASGSKDRIIKLWSLTERKEMYSLKGHTDDVLCVAFSPDGQLLASGAGGNDKTIRIIRLNENLVQTLTVSSDWFTGGINALSFSYDGKILAGGGNDKTVKLWNVETGQEIKTLTGHSQAVYAVAFSPNGKILASAGNDKTVKLWEVDLEGVVEISTVKCADEGIYSLAFSPDGKVLATGSGDKIITLLPCQ